MTFMTVTGSQSTVLLEQDHARLQPFRTLMQQWSSSVGSFYITFLGAIGSHSSRSHPAITDFCSVHFLLSNCCGFVLRGEAAKARIPLLLRTLQAAIQPRYVEPSNVLIIILIICLLWLAVVIFLA